MGSVAFCIHEVERDAFDRWAVECGMRVLHTEIRHPGEGGFSHAWLIWLVCSEEDFVVVSLAWCDKLMGSCHSPNSVDEFSFWGWHVSN